MKRLITMTSLLALSTQVAASSQPKLQLGSDRNSFENPLVQPQDPALAGGGRDQSLQFGDILYGGAKADILFGRLGIDVLFGNQGDDVLAGGTEDFNPFNRDRAFGGPGNDSFLWAPGDGSDFFDGGDGSKDTLILGLIGELDENGNPVFRVQNDQNADEPFISPKTKLPVIDVVNSPGFCEVIDGQNWQDKQTLNALNLDHLVRFSIRQVADDFNAGLQSEDNGLRVTIHLKNTEYLICASRKGGEIEVLDLTQSPPRQAHLDELPDQIQSLLRSVSEQENGDDDASQYMRKRYDAVYENQGKSYRNTVWFDGNSGWFQTSFAKGEFYEVSYHGSMVEGYWRNQGEKGWFRFHFSNPDSFEGTWGYGELGSPVGGRWHGNAAPAW